MRIYSNGRPGGPAAKRAPVLRGRVYLDFFGESEVVEVGTATGVSSDADEGAGDEDLELLASEW